MKSRFKDQRVLEVALSRPFLNGTIMFSSISPDFEKNLKEELFGCFKYINIPFRELEHMPTRDRKAYIQMHNKAVKKENDEYERLSKGGNGTQSTSEDMLDVFTDMSQKNMAPPARTEYTGIGN